MVPIFKKGDKKIATNYRPIALLPVMSKVFEKIIDKQLNLKLNQGGYIDDNQYGFRQDHSTEDAVLKISDFVEKNIAAGNKVGAVFTN